jgi:arylsulfatase A-like enzyme
LKNSFVCFFILIFSGLNAQEKPNFLWLVCEDQSLFFAAYGDSNAYTPNINQLAKDGIVYENCFSTSPVCAPSRSSLITGLYPTNIGTQHMRAYKRGKRGNNPHNNLPFYSPVPERRVQFFTEILRAGNYYCSNNSKEDYNMHCSPLAWDESSPKAHWRKREGSQPFFFCF